MIAVGARGRHGVSAWLQQKAWHHPEWSAGLLAVGSWAILIAHHLRHRGTGPTSWLHEQLAWILMSAAMMLPSALPTLRHVALNSKWQRRQRGSALFLVSYLGVWVAFGLVVLSIAAVAGVRVGTGGSLAIALVIASGWELTILKRRCQRACHRTVPLPPEGWKADSACLRFGLRYGLACVGACWALMLPMAVVGHDDLPLMMLLTALVVSEEVLTKGSKLRPIAALTLLMYAAVTLSAFGTS